jgi:hypothetical protein
MRHVIVALLLAQQGPEAPPPATASAAVAACVAAVRVEAPTFDAYYDARLHSIHWLGSERAGYTFRKCMHDRGISIRTTPKAPSTPAAKEIRQ